MSEQQDQHIVHIDLNMLTPLQLATLAICVQKLEEQAESSESETALQWQSEVVQLRLLRDTGLFVAHQFLTSAQAELNSNV